MMDRIREYFTGTEMTPEIVQKAEGLLMV